MNLGDANLKTVNSSSLDALTAHAYVHSDNLPASKPQLLLHSTSKRSVTASDDYYSLSEPASDPSSGDERATIVRYKTPPSQIQSANPSRALLSVEQTPPKHIEPPIIQALPRSIRFVEKQPSGPNAVAAADSMRAWKSSKTDVSPPTPGVDDTPYIQFAINQLTLDEELMGPRRFVANEGDKSPVQEEVQPVVDDRSYTQQPEPIVTRDPRRHNFEPPQPQPQSDSEVAHKVLIPARRPQNSYLHPSLNFIPKPLRVLPLAGLIVLCLLMIAALIFSSVWAAQHNGLWEYDGLGTNRYNLFEFLPQIIGALITLWIMIIQTAVQRILPFTLLASDKHRQHTGALEHVPLFLTNYLIPSLSTFVHGEPILGVCSIIFWLNLFTIPLLSCVFQTRLYTFDSEGVWMWTVVQPVIWTLIVLYWILVITLMLLAIRLGTRSTGLKWDPTSLADIFVLLRRSNVAPNFQGSEVRAAPTRSRPVSLGYWRSSDRPDDIFYAIGEDHALALERHRMEAEKLQEDDLESQQPIKGATIESLQTDVHSPAVRYRWTPWFMRDGWWILWLVVAFVLTTAFLVVSFVHQAVDFGFLPLLPAPTTTLGFSPANFLYSFVPSVLGMILFLGWQPIDMYHRALEPFARLANPQGATAEQSLLLCYTSYLPLEVSIRAALNGHFRVAWISFISLLSITLPVIAGGVFTAEFNVPAQDVREVATMPAYYALVVFIIIYALSFLALWPEPKRYLPHDIRTVGDIISFVYQSQMTNDAAFREPRSKTDLVTRLLSSEGATAMPRYAFGVYVGRDGTEHLGIDRLKRPGSGEMFVYSGRR
ncbi:hypothetical protein MMC13_002135 [Lambiella insularis]|nr:hypothetical protein [Lambiella insularis]